MLPEVRLICKSAHFALHVQEKIESYGLRVNSSGEYTILLDAPYGTALTELDNNQVDLSKTLVFTSNLCPEYWKDILELPVKGLVIDSFDQHTCHTALKNVYSGQQFIQLQPAPDAKLNTTEHQVLALIAKSFCNKEIHAITGKSIKTIEGAVTKLLEKLAIAYPELRFSNRSCLVQYYHGFWHNIEKNNKWLRLGKANRALPRKNQSITN